MISAIPISAAKICPKNVECDPHVSEVKSPAFQEKFCFQAHQWFRDECVRPLKFKAEVQSATVRYKDKTEAELRLVREDDKK